MTVILGYWDLRGVSSTAFTAELKNHWLETNPGNWSSYELYNTATLTVLGHIRLVDYCNVAV